MQRYGSVISLDPAQMEEYKRVHAAVWPDVLKQIRANERTRLGRRSGRSTAHRFRPYAGDVE